MDRIEQLRTQFEQKLRATNRYAASPIKDNILKRKDGVYCENAIEAAWHGFLMAHEDVPESLQLPPHIESLREAAAAPAACAAEWVTEAWADEHFGSDAEARFVALSSPAAITELFSLLETMKTLSTKDAIDAERYRAICDRHVYGIYRRFVSSVTEYSSGAARKEIDAWADAVRAEVAAYAALTDDEKRAGLEKSIAATAAAPPAGEDN